MMDRFEHQVDIYEDISLGSDRMVLFAGPCAAESYDLCLEVGETMKDLCMKLGIE